MIYPVNNINRNTIKSDKLEISFLDNGNLSEIRNGIYRINTYVGSYFNPSVSNIFLKIEKDNKEYYTRLLGLNSPSKFKVTDNKAYYYGSFMGVNYQVIVSIIDNIFYYQVNLNKNKDIKKACVYYGLDVSIHNIYAIRNNEAYVSQYIDHYIENKNDSFIICSRQNQEQPLYLEVGSFNRTIGYVTDGFDFYKTNYKELNVPLAIFDEILANRNYQYEFSFPTLQTEYFNLNEDIEFVFYNAYENNHEDRITSSKYYEISKEKFIHNDFIKTIGFKEIETKYSLDNIINSTNITNDKLEEYYSEFLYPEYDGDVLLSFFTKDGSHVVLKNKETKLERPSGNIIISQNKVNDEFDFENVISSTSYMMGLFNSQIVNGNVTFNKLLSNIRNPLNIIKSSGQRIFIKIDNEYKLLNMPALFEMGLNYFKWLYLINDDVITIKSFTCLDKSKITLEFNSSNNIKYELLILNFLSMGEIENENKEDIEINNNQIKISFLDGSMTKNKYPNLSFVYECNKDFVYLSEKEYFKNYESNENMFMIKLNENSFNLQIRTYETDNKFESFEIETNKYLNEINSFKNEFEINSPNKELNSNNYLLNWFIHDAMIHYLSPHGLEQYNGAAWGTRDVCQGPFELFMSFGKYKYARKIILDVFTHQFYETGDFPQWFMFDKFYNILDLSSHGDIIIWPLRMIVLYLKETNDYSVLNEIVPYMVKENITFDHHENILSHVKKLFNTILNSCINNTSLPVYGGGDWDDTLQPSNPKLKLEMVSGWTPILIYEVLNEAVILFNDIDKELSNNMKDFVNNLKLDYNKYLIKDNIPAGFIHFNNEEKLIIHPSNNESLKYRLLPLSRGIKSKIFNDEVTKNALSIIKNELTFPDGIRLMDHAVKYNGGIKKYFNRAETASNFGREIGLSYSHANIRVAEMYSSINRYDDAIDTLYKVNPIIVNDYVSNASIRQRNSYFSSSDGAFINRYVAYDEFDKLKSGLINTKAGWRVYSSGPGIYIHTLISEIFGLKQDSKYLYFNNINTKELNNLRIKFKLDNKIINIKYLNGENKVLFNGKEINNNYINKNDLLDNNDIIIYGKVLDANNDDIILIEKEIRKSFDFFYEQSNLNKDNQFYGLTKDIYEKGVNNNISSTAAIGFAFASFVIGVERGYINYLEGYNIVNKTLDTIIKLPSFHGFLPHFVNINDGTSKSEFSTIDTTILLMGAITASSYFKGNIKRKVDYLIEKLDFSIFERTKDDKLFINMAYSEYKWKENNGYCPAVWDHYAEQLMMYILYAGLENSDKDKAIKLYNSFTRYVGNYKGYEVIYSYKNPLFVHQFSHAFIDFSKLIDCNGIDWHKNSVNATLANKQFCLDHSEFKTYNDHSWGLTAFKGKDRYQVLGSKPNGFPNNPCVDDTDGSVSPYAALSSIVFTPKESIECLRYFDSIKELNGKYGLYDSYNLDIDFISKAYLGIDKGPTIIMLDNYLFGTTWKYFMQNDIYKRGIKVLNFNKRKEL